MPTMRDRFVHVTERLLDERPDLAVVLADISTERFERAGERHPDRVVNLGIREQLLVGVAGGLALSGLRPIAHTYAPFLVERPFEQVKLDLGHQGLGAILVSVGASHDWAAGGRTHHAPEDVALLSTLPGWTIHVPGHPDEVEGLLRAAVGGDDRVYLRLSERVNERARPTGAGLQVVRSGGGATVVAVGPMLDAVLEATADREVTVLYASTVRPLDPTGLLAAAAMDVILVEPCLEGTSLGALVEALGPAPHRLLPIGVPRGELRRYGTWREHDAELGLDAAGLRVRIAAFLDEGRGPQAGRPSAA